MYIFNLLKTVVYFHFFSQKCLCNDTIDLSLNYNISSRTELNSDPNVTFATTIGHNTNNTVEILSPQTDSASAPKNSANIEFGLTEFEPSSISCSNLPDQDCSTKKKEEICLDITSRKTTAEIKYEIKDFIETFVPLHDYMFSCVKVGSTGNNQERFLWKSESYHSNSNKVTINFTSNSQLVTIHMINGNFTKFYNDEYNDWIKVNRQQATPVDIDIKATNKYFLYRHLHSNFWHWYTAKDYFLFKCLYYGGSSVWRTYDLRQMAYKVVLHHKSIETLEIHLINGIIKYYYRYGTGFPWYYTHEKKCSYYGIHRKHYYEPRDYPKTTKQVNFTFNYMAFGNQKMSDITDYLLDDEIYDLGDKRFNEGIHGLGLKMIDIMMWNNVSYSKLAVKVPLLKRPLFVMVHRKNKWKSGYSKDPNLLKERLIFAST